MHGLSRSQVVPPGVSARECGTSGSASHCLSGSASCSLPASRPLARPGPPATTLPRVLSLQLPVSVPPTCVDDCFFFNSLVVGLLRSRATPWLLVESSIFCQFWLLFVFKFAVLLVVQGGWVSTYASILAGSLFTKSFTTKSSACNSVTQQYHTQANRTTF